MLVVAPAQARTHTIPLESPAVILPQESPTPAPTPTPDPVLEQATRDANLADQLKKKAVSDQERAEAEAAKLKAIAQPFGAPNNVTVPTGSVQTDAAGWVESQMLAQEAARQLTGRLTKYLCQGPKDAQGENLPINKLVIYNANDLTGVEMYGAVMGQLQRLKSELHTKMVKQKRCSTKQSQRESLSLLTLEVWRLPRHRASPRASSSLLPS